MLTYSIGKEIKVGDYVRTKDGRIEKIKIINEYCIITKYDNQEDNISKNVNWYAESGREINIENIVKHSPKLIDLIEVGDYVNGYRIDNIVDGVLIHRANGIDRSGFLIPIAQYDTDIINIVTHEQFKLVEYEV